MSTHMLQPALPLEISDAVIDHLHSDIKALGVCSSVCSEWLIRSRHHIFSTVQLWPWRVRKFFELASSESCTFKNHVYHIELDDSKANKEASKSQVPATHHTPRQNDTNVLFIDFMSKSDLPCLVDVRSIQVRNVNWTTLTPQDQVTLRHRLAKFTKLERLEFHDVVFHDLREVVRIVHLFPVLHHLTANLTFMKYLEYNIDSAGKLKMPSQLRSLELGTDDAIPVVLTCVESGGSNPHVFGLKLQSIKAHHLQYIRRVLRRSGKQLQKLSLAFERAEFTRESRDSIVNAVDLSKLSQLQKLTISCLTLDGESATHNLESALPSILSRIESSCLDTVELNLQIKADVISAALDWSHLERVLLALHFFGLGQVRLVLDMDRSSREGILPESAEFGEQIRGCLPELDRRGVLHILYAEAESQGELMQYGEAIDLTKS